MIKKYIIWGTGKYAENQLKKIKLAGEKLNLEIVGFIDNDKMKWNTYFNGIKIYPPNDLLKIEFDYLDIWVIDGVDKIRKQIKEQFSISSSKMRDISLDYKEYICELLKDSTDKEVRDFLEIFRKKQELSVFAYKEYRIEQPREVFYDKNKDLNYVFFEDKKMYLSRKKKLKIVGNKKYVSNIWQEQDLNSPHRYEENEVVVEVGDVLVDAGVCEGNFSLHNIDKVSKVYLVECDQDWMEALNATFEPYKNKVVFCNKFLSNRDSENSITLDSLVNGHVNFIKMDIEGEEVNALKGADRILSENSNLKCSICSYHKHGDEEKIRDILGNKGFKTSTSNGYMLFIYDDDIWCNPELRKGIVRGYKEE